MKDYYDVYYFVNIKWKDIDKTILKQAIYTTFEHRNSQNELENNEQIIENLEKDKYLNELWEQYKSKHNYAKNLLFKDTIESLKFIFRELIKT